MKRPTNKELGLNGRKVLFAPINLMMFILLFPLACISRPLGFGHIGEFIVYFLLLRIGVVLFEKDVFLIHPRQVLPFSLLILLIFGYYGYETIAWIW